MISLWDMPRISGPPTAGHFYDEVVPFHYRIEQQERWIRSSLLLITVCHTQYLKKGQHNQEGDFYRMGRILVLEGNLDLKLDMDGI